MLNEAVTDFDEVIDTVQVVNDPLQAPDHPENVEPDEALAISTTFVPDEAVVEHVEPQLIPEGLEVTVPLPEPDLETHKACRAALVNEAVTDLDEVIVTVQRLLDPLQAPDHPENVAPDEALA